MNEFKSVLNEVRKVINGKDREIIITMLALLANGNILIEDIPGIGPARRKDLMGYFKDISRIREASIEELMQAPSMNRNAAEAVYGFFHRE